MQITHEEARRLIQFEADKSLQGNERNLLAVHLKSCQECRTYAGEIKDVELLLGSMMHTRWNRQPPSIQKETAVPRNVPKLTEGFIFATRVIAMGVLCLAVLFNIWQFTKPSGQEPSPSSAGIPPVPTPSLYSTTTMGVSEDCKQVRHTVQKNETLREIADRFSVSPEDILRINNMDRDTVSPSMSLWIPVCIPTTPGTTDTAVTTFTPYLGSTTTPVNGPTQ